MGSVEDSPFSWLVCASTFFYQLILGAFDYNMGIFYVIFQDALVGTDSSIALITSLHLGILNLFALIAGPLTEHYGERSMSYLGTLLTFVGFVCSSQVTQVFHLYITYSLLHGIGISILYVASMSAINKYFRKYEPLAGSIAMSAHGVGCLLFAPIIEGLNGYYGWRGAFLILAGICLQGMITANVYRPVPRKGDGTVDDAPSALTKISSFQRLWNILEKYKFVCCNGRFVCLNLSQMFLFFSATLIMNHLVSYIISLGFAVNEAAKVNIILGSSVAAGRVFFGFVAQKFPFDIFILPTVLSVFVAILTLLLPLTSNLVLIFVYAGLFAFGNGAGVGLLLPMMSKSIPQEYIPTGLGMNCLFCAAAIIPGPPLAAAMYTLSNTYAPSFYMAGAIFLISGFFTFLAMRIEHCCHQARDSVEDLAESKEKL